MISVITMHYRSSATVTRSGVIPISSALPVKSNSPLPALNQGIGSNTRIGKQQRSQLDEHLTDLKNKQRTFFSVSHPEAPLEYAPTPEHESYLMQPNFVNKKSPIINHSTSPEDFLTSRSIQDICFYNSPKNSAHFCPIMPEDDSHNFNFTPLLSEEGVSIKTHSDNTEFPPLTPFTQLSSLSRLNSPLHDYAPAASERYFTPFTPDSPSSPLFDIYHSET